MLERRSAVVVSMMNARPACADAPGTTTSICSTLDQRSQSRQRSLCPSETTASSLSSSRMTALRLAAGSGLPASAMSTMGSPLKPCRKAAPTCGWEELSVVPPDKSTPVTLRSRCRVTARGGFTPCRLPPCPTRSAREMVAAPSAHNRAKGSRRIPIKRSTGLPHKSLRRGSSIPVVNA